MDFFVYEIFWWVFLFFFAFEIVVGSVKLYGVIDGFTLVIVSSLACYDCMGAFIDILYLCFWSKLFCVHI